jgi:L-ascorbate metabolism protein UlaG (beta-lactamase superfamily)
VIDRRRGGDSNEATLRWLGQSGFAIGYRGELALIDPYLSDSLTKKYAATATPHVRISPKVVEPEELARTSITLLAATHQHSDHLDPETLAPIVRARRAQGEDVPLVAPEAWRALAAQRADIAPADVVGCDEGQTVRIGSFELTALASAHEQIEYDDDGHCRYLGYVIRVGGRTFYHSGDTLYYDGLADRLRPFAVDVALLPINGKVGNMSGADAARLACDAGVRLVVPCHYGMFAFNTADPAVEFIPACERIGQASRVVGLGETMMVA